MYLFPSREKRKAPKDNAERASTAYDSGTFSELIDFNKVSQQRNNGGCFFHSDA